MACFLFFKPNSEQILQTLAMAPAKLRAIWLAAFVIIPLWLRVVPKYLNLTFNKTNPAQAYCWGASAELKLG